MTRCKVCKTEFVRRSMTHKACSEGCALVLAQAVRLKLEKKRDAATRVRLKTRTQLARSAQTDFNAWVRYRDSALPCVSCHRPASWGGQWHASHLLSVGARPDLRFDPANVHKACSICNAYRSGNVGPYRVELIKRIGLAEVERLEGPAQGEKLTRDELIELRARYAKLARELKGANQ